MDISEIKRVHITKTAIGRASKFIIAEISDGKTKIFVLRSSNQEFHKEIFGSLVDEFGRNFGLRIKGGGRIFVDMPDKQIWAWGESTAYGAPDYIQVKKLLQENYKGFEIILGKYLL